MSMHGAKTVVEQHVKHLETFVVELEKERDTMRHKADLAQLRYEIYIEKYNDLKSILEEMKLEIPTIQRSDCY
ncbi:hypothetical protein [Paenibacillus sp. ISL-20]|uniref:hypothetical protein n=1 Tax=Paenibacillus sp. ISL-20 TaxID=2819163 RepID=UPI001BEBE19A|nr:hypothetical protein [Paenibacillus sp. ISL-20]MBT2759928.1 hypothetical protein [Paenibacillus sp. ISL-20]